DELAAIDHRAKRLLVDEVVLAAVPVLAAGLSRRVRDRQRQVRVELEQSLDEARLAGAARRGDCVEVAGIVHSSFASTRQFTCRRFLGGGSRRPRCLAMTSGVRQIAAARAYGDRTRASQRSSARTCPSSTATA